MAWYETEAPHWLGPAWRSEVTSWIDGALSAQGHRRTGPLTPVHLRVWSVVCRAQTSVGDVYFKSAPPGMDFEPALTQHLNAHGAAGLRLIAVDAQRNWMLTHAESVTARELHGSSPEGVVHWKKLLTRYAHLQLALAPDADDLVRAGVPDLRLERLPEQFDALVGCGHLHCGDDGLSGPELRALTALRPRLVSLCEELAGAGIPQTLQHNDLHDSNVFVREGEYIIFDWGDASVAHPLFDCEVLFAVARGRFGLEPGVDGFLSFRDAYLGPFAERSSMDDVLGALRLSIPLAKLCRAMTWHRIVDLPSGEGAREVVARRAKQLLGMLSGDPAVRVGPSSYL
jgi:hypothetical protein